MKRLGMILLSSLLIALLGVEGALRLFDPWGLTRMIDDLNRLNTLLRPLPSGGYGLQPGTHHMAGWTLTVLPDGTRWIPDNHEASCTVAIVGDSVAMGWGVDDAQTWVNQIARQVPAVHLIDAGIVGYNIQDVYETLPPADAYLYLLIDNDDQPRLSFFGARTTYSLALQAYLDFITWAHEPPGNAVFFATYLDRLEAIPHLHIIAFSGERLAQNLPQTNMIPPYTSRISRADPHPNTTGNQEIAAAILPIVQTMLARDCPLEKLLYNGMER